MNSLLSQGLILTALTVLFFAAVFAAIDWFDAQIYMLRLFNWLESIGAWGPILFIVIDILAVVLLLPSIFLTLGAGFLFGAVLGTAYVMIGSTIGAALAFLIGRHLFGRRARRFIRSKSEWQRIDEGLAREDWKFVMVSRVMPLFPYKLSNYFFGVTRFSFKGFVIGTVIGIAPFTVFNAYLGSLAADLTVLGVQHLPSSTLGWTLYIGGFIIALLAIAYSVSLARRTLQDYDENVGQHDLRAGQ